MDCFLRGNLWAATVEPPVASSVCSIRPNSRKETQVYSILTFRDIAEPLASLAIPGRLTVA